VSTLEKRMLKVRKRWVKEEINPEAETQNC
jgi:hypothetical protein